ncbi:MAG: SusD/RagB family nutrient-binding outer membrane lipoprotein [Phaeodactylibacter sp.]|nr:SusD/RagB family nutrient-binding outer membrane lipoprotein [Phaeodactylibacter sp.]MCB9047964.1 SusD/RagB family nutrient-binding outer membrane lipoprotein [Lewinellaceae bacterium]
MKYILKRLFLSVLALTFALQSCSDFGDTNIDPLAATEINPDFQFSFLQLRVSGERYENWRTVLIYSSTMIQHLAALPEYWSGDKYLYNAQYSGSLMERCYQQQVLQAVDLTNTLEKMQAEGEPVSNKLAATRIWKVAMFHRITDLYGDIPYSEAGKGFLEGIDNPKYDPQSEIYFDMLKELEEATAQLNSSDPTFGSADFIYGGDVDQWRRYGYSLMLRLGMRLTKVDPASAEAWVKKAIAGGVMTSQDDSAKVPHTDGPEGINRNGIGEVWLADNNQHLSNFFVTWMKDHSDPRLDVLGVVPNGTEQKGLPNGYNATTIKDYLGLNPDDDVDMEQFSNVNDVLVTTASPMIFMYYSEVEFLLAEAAVRGWASDAEAHYNAGVRAAMKQYGDLFDPSAAVDDAAIDAYLAANPFDGSLKMIGEQHWAANFMNEYEAYANYRRTGFPELTPVNYQGNVTGGQIPRRLAYFEGEAANNPTELNAALQRQGMPTDFTQMLKVPMWWDKQ